MAFDVQGYLQTGFNVSLASGGTTKQISISVSCAFTTSNPVILIKKSLTCTCSTTFTTVGVVRNTKYISLTISSATNTTGQIFVKRGIYLTASCQITTNSPPLEIGTSVKQISLTCNTSFTTAGNIGIKKYISLNASTSFNTSGNILRKIYISLSANSVYSTVGLLKNKIFISAQSNFAFNTSGSLGLIKRLVLTALVTFDTIGILKNKKSISLSSSTLFDTSGILKVKRYLSLSSFSAITTSSFPLGIKKYLSINSATVFTTNDFVLRRFIRNTLTINSYIETTGTLRNGVAPLSLTCNTGFTISEVPLGIKKVISLTCNTVFDSSGTLGNKKLMSFSVNSVFTTSATLNAKNTLSLTVNSVFSSIGAIRNKKYLSLDVSVKIETMSIGYLGIYKRTSLSIATAFSTGTSILRSYKRLSVNATSIFNTQGALSQKKILDLQVYAQITTATFTLGVLCPQEINIQCSFVTSAPSLNFENAFREIHTAQSIIDAELIGVSKIELLSEIINPIGRIFETNSYCFVYLYAYSEIRLSEFQ